MKKFLSALVLIGSVMASHIALAAERTVTFTVEGMYCEACPYIIKTALEAVPGVMRAAASFETKTATVTFDDAKTTTDAIAAASKDAGYPAQPVQ